VVVWIFFGVAIHITSIVVALLILNHVIIWNTPEGFVSYIYSYTGVCILDVCFLIAWRMLWVKERKRAKIGNNHFGADGENFPDQGSTTSARDYRMMRNRLLSVSIGTLAVFAGCIFLVVTGRTLTEPAPEGSRSGAYQSGLEV
jgi:Ca2+/Na+ antiporter